jgi:hypothetical protein
LGDREMITRLKVRQIDEVQFLGAMRNDDVEVRIASFCTINQ